MKLTDERIEKLDILLTIKPAAISTIELKRQGTLGRDASMYS